jgi:hypothetical protein
VTSNSNNEDATEQEEGNILVYFTKFPTLATTAGGQNPTLYLNALKSSGASVLAFVYTVAKPLGFWA